MEDEPVKSESRLFKWDIVAGAVTIAIGAFFLNFGWGLRPGTLSRMGPGFVPISISYMMLALGGILILQGLMRPSETINWPLIRPLLTLLLCPILFAFLIGPLGLVLTVIIVASVGRLAQANSFGLEAILMPLLLAAFCVVLFSYLLNLSIPLWPRT